MSRGEQSPRTPDEVAPARRGRVLVIDDEPMITRAVLRILAGEHDVVAVDSARAALDHLVAGERFDVILCDLMMPVMSGIELHARVCHLADEQAARMVFLTGGAYTPEAHAFLSQVNNACVDKPFDAGHLRELINERVR